MKKKQFLIRVRIVDRSDNETEIDTPWTGQPFDADNDDAYLTAYTDAVEGLKKVLGAIADHCKMLALFGKSRKPVEHTVQLLCHCPKHEGVEVLGHWRGKVCYDNDGHKYELYKTVKFD